jgi:DNA repair protein RecO (recombination protein O)
MTESAHGLILRTRLLTETSLIVHWLTPELGRIATVAKGARRPKSPFAGKLDLFYAADFSFSRSRHSELHTLREVQLRETHRALREDILKLQQAAYAAAFIEQATETDTPLPGLLALLEKFLTALCGASAMPQTVFAIELKLLREFGLDPDLAETKLTPGAQQIARRLANDDWPQIFRVKPAAAQVQELRQWLHEFLVFNLGRLPRGRAAALGEGH